MVNLEAEDRKQLITLLKDLPELATERSRQQILELAGLKQLIPMINLSGASFVAVSEIVSYLSNYGRLTYDDEALGQLLNTLKSLMGVQQQEFLDMLLTKYDMMTPIARLPAINEWRGGKTTSDVLEKIIGENTLRPISFLQQGLQVARSVAYIGVITSQERWSGTGFLVAQDLLLTNNHVLPSSNLLADTIFRFNYEENFQGEAQQTDEYRPKPNGAFHTNQALDYTLVQLGGEPGKKWGWLPLTSKAISIGSRVNIIQHPSGQPKQISLQNNFVQYVGGNVVQYITSTLQGSSGSPVFNDGWQIVALHHAGGNIPEPTTQQRYFRNEGIQIESILADLPLELVNLLKAARNTSL
ncbi:MAG: trypsin-like peptidase domain-containing protein [Nostoc sp. DedQUE08]|uniref:trypsin-like peptidase domain-containing protein n=1 Tax=unclassified Nostoc TaxID=2593658 RepID=UPI002AD1E04A|nr:MULTISPECIES: trypsin-like peptidase domain-containing protein [unclassified Nostoc]MDZ8067095.1 trypsin-like peptidase domain-containing protein [Nostoc sp. DedQUE08]MDZ8131826.1 trypsin-like peptidase domain-containing protein [Nostoc sp. DedQUE07]